MNGVARISARAGAPKLLSPAQYAQTIALAYLCAPHGSDEEDELERALGATCDRYGLELGEIIEGLQAQHVSFAVEALEEAEPTGAEVVRRVEGLRGWSDEVVLAEFRGMRDATTGTGIVWRETLRAELERRGLDYAGDAS